MSEIVKVNRNLIWAQNAIETVYVHNKYSGTLSPGDVVVLDVADSTSTEIAVDVTSTQDDKAVFGMAIETMATGAYGLVQTKGPTALLKTYGAISVGSYLSAYGTATYAVAATSGKGGVFAIALESQSSGAQVTDAYLTGGAGRFDTAATSATFASATFTGTTQVSSTSRLQFYDSGLYIYSSADGTLDIVADTILNLNAASVHLVDAKVLKFGSSQDILMQWDGTNFIIEPAADDAVFEIGNSATSQKAFDVKIYGGTGSGASYATFDAGANTLIFTGYDIQFKDADLLNFGTATSAAGDVSIWFDDDSGGLQIYPAGGAEAFTIGAASHLMNTTITGTFTVGVDDVGHDVIFYAATASHLVWFDENGDTDGCWYFGADQKGIMTKWYGDTTGCGIFWDPSGDTNGSLAVGASGGDKGCDFYCYGVTNGNLLQWDNSANALELTGTAGKIFDVVSALTGASALNAVKWAIADATTQTTGYNAAFLCEVTKTGNSSATEYSAARFNLLLNTDVQSGLYNAIKAKVGTGAASTLTSANVNGIFVSMDDIGSCSSMNCMWLEIYGSSGSDNSFIRFHSQGGNQVENLFKVWGSNAPSVLIDHQLSIGNTGGYVDAGGTAGDQCVGHLKLDFDGTAAYINIFSDNS